MSTLFWDCQTGISGDMAVASLLDLGASEGAVREALEPLSGEGFELRVGRVAKAGLDCCDFDVVLDQAHDGHDHDMSYLYDPEWKPGEGAAPVAPSTRTVMGVVTITAATRR